MKVLKFGGTSIGDAESVRRVCRIVGVRQKEPTVLVFSAVGDTTDRLDKLGTMSAEGKRDDAMRQIAELQRIHLGLLDQVCRDLNQQENVLRDWEGLFGDLQRLAAAIAAIGDVSPPVKARLLGFGELLSSSLLAAALRVQGVPAVWVDARELIFTKGDPLNGEPLRAEVESRCRVLLPPLLESGLVPVTQGFIASSRDGAVSTLGRGGSDCTAALIGAALAADEVEIWTDVDGIMTADPRFVPDAKRVPTLSLEEAAELATLGARVLHPGSLTPSIELEIPVRVRNTGRPDGQGTIVQARSVINGNPVRSIAFRGGLNAIKLRFERGPRTHDALEKIFRIFDRHKVSPEVVSTSDASVAVGCMSTPQGLLADLATVGAVSVTPDQAVVGVVGSGLGRSPRIVGRVFEAIGDARITLVSIGGADCTIGFLVDEAEAPEIVRRLHRSLFAAPIETTVASREIQRVAYSA